MSQPVPPSAVSRRSLLRGVVTTGAVGTAAAVADLAGGVRSAAAAGPGPAAAAAAAQQHDVLVVLTLRGGFDALSAVVPAGDEEYLRARPTIGIPADRLLALDSRFGLHPAMHPLRRWWREGALAVVHAVGQPGAGRSHLLASAALDSGGQRDVGGWLDRALGSVTSTAWPAAYLGSTTLPGSLRAASAHGGQAVGLKSAAELDLTGLTGTARSRWLAALTALHADAPGRRKLPVASTLAAIKALPQTGGAAAAVPADRYPATDLGSALREVAGLVRARVGVRAVCVEHDGWDLHAAAGSGSADRDAPAARAPMSARLADLARSLDAFADDLGPDLDRVILVTQTEFGRRVSENGSGGTDHGAASAMLLLGGGVRGGQVYGDWPGLARSARDRDGLRISTDQRLVLAEVLAERCGVSTGPVFPGLRGRPLGLVRSR